VTCVVIIRPACPAKILPACNDVHNLHTCAAETEVCQGFRRMLLMGEISGLRGLPPKTI